MNDLSYMDNMGAHRYKAPKKLTPTQVRIIRVSDRTNKDLAELFNVSPNCIHNTRRGVYHKDIK